MASITDRHIPWLMFLDKHIYQPEHADGVALLTISGDIRYQGGSLTSTPSHQLRFLLPFLTYHSEKFNEAVYKAKIPLLVGSSNRTEHFFVFQKSMRSIYCRAYSSGESLVVIRTKSGFLIAHIGANKHCASSIKAIEDFCDWL